MKNKKEKVMDEIKYLPEVWVDLKDDKIEGTEYKYSISSYGRVWNKVDEVFVAPNLAGIPQYFYVNLQVGGVRKQRRVHYLQAYSFYGKPPKDNAGSVKKQTCDHKDINRFNNSLWNLRWASRKEQANNIRSNVVVEGTQLFERLEQEYPEYNITKIIACNSYFKIKYFEKGFSYDDTKILWEQKELFNGSGGALVDIKGKSVYTKELCRIFHLPYQRLRELNKEGYKAYEIFPYFKIKPQEYTGSYEINGMWFPTKKSLCDYYNITQSGFNKRAKDGYSVEANVSYRQGDINRVLIDGYFMSIAEHCERVGVSPTRVLLYRQKENLSLEEALIKAKNPTRIIKHIINGYSEIYGEFNNVLMRNKYIWEMFGLSPHTSSTYLSKRKELTLPDVIKLKGGDTAGLTIEPYIK